MNQARRIACFRPNDSKAAIPHLLAARLNSSSKARKTKVKIRKNSYYIFIKKWHTKYECTQKNKCDEKHNYQREYKRYSIVVRTAFHHIYVRNRMLSV